MRAGSLRHEITIERSVDYVRPSGDVGQVWEQIGCLRAELRQNTANEFLNGTLEGTSQKAVFVVRWNDRIKVGDRILHDGKTWQIVGLEEVGVKRGLEIMVVSP